ncbi:hypothetical protein L6R50_22325 [Myxococcota bacterium]|nr:hypothetical protein [Myxococcota bacterium]
MPDPVRLLPLGAALVLGAGCGDPEDPPAPGAADTPFEVAADEARAKLTVTAGGAPLLELLPGGIEAQAVSAEVEEAYGAFLFHDDVAWTLRAEALEAREGGGWDVVGPGGRRIGALEVSFPTDRALWDAEGRGEMSLRIALDVSVASEAESQGRVPRVGLSFACAEGDAFMGFGAQTAATDHRGHRLPVWVSEQGIGKAESDEPPDDWFLRGHHSTSYFPVPLFHDLGREVPFAVLHDGTSRSVFDLCAADPGVWTMAMEGAEATVRLFAGGTGAALQAQVTERIGRPPPLPDWAFGVWIDAVGGQERVQEKVERLRAADVPASAIWTEDWVGGEEGATGYHLRYDWYPDTALYPDLPGLAEWLLGHGLRFQGYVNPFLTEGTRTAQDAAVAGAYVVGGDGEALTFPGPLFDEVGLLDLWSDAGLGLLGEAVGRMAEQGFGSWMADYAEWLPVGAAVEPGPGRYAHNAYPLAWQRANRDLAVGIAPPGEPPVYFARSGFTGSGAIAPVIWAGDQQTSFGTDDGLPTVVPIGVGLGLAGVAAFAHDVAGYSSFGVPPSTEELFRRWTALGAWTPVMRTHHGAYADDNWSWDRDEASTGFFREFAHLHMRLLPLWRGLHLEATRTGMPSWRHPALHFPGDEGARRAEDWFLVGEGIAVYPVLAEGATGRTCALPAGASWVPWTGGGARQGGGEVQADAPAFEGDAAASIPVWVRAGTWVPLLDEGVRTAVPGPVAGLLSSSEVPEFTEALWFAGAEGRAGAAAPSTREDWGIELEQVAGGGAPLVGWVDAGGQAVGECPGGEASGSSPCTLSPGPGDDARIWLSAGAGASLHDSAGALLEARVESGVAGEGRIVTVRGLGP